MNQKPRLFAYSTLPATLQVLMVQTPSAQLFEHRTQVGVAKFQASEIAQEMSRADGLPQLINLTLHAVESVGTCPDPGLFGRQGV